MDKVFRALADPSRRRLLDSLNARAGQSLRELCEGLDMTRQSVSKHLAVLEAANLVTSIRRGREKLHYLNAAPINEISERWIDHYSRGRVEALANLKRALEDSSMDNPSFVYTTYIQSTPEQVWRGLTDPAFTSQYWGMNFDTDWKQGSTYTLDHRGVTIDDPAQVILEADPFRHLSYTWHTFTPEWGEALEIDPDRLERIAAERRSKVSFEIEPAGESVKLTVLHEDFAPGSEVLGMISGGWPKVFASLKTLLETGATLRTT
jgi:DNA-binding transcriptional ArsR family regulator/uncharacterized protein YndB with AHSA1/START domain